MQTDYLSMLWTGKLTDTNSTYLLIHLNVCAQSHAENNVKTCLVHFVELKMANKYINK